MTYLGNLVWEPEWVSVEEVSGLSRGRWICGGTERDDDHSEPGGTARWPYHPVSLGLPSNHDQKVANVPPAHAPVAAATVGSVSTRPPAAES